VRFTGTVIKYFAIINDVFFGRPEKKKYNLSSAYISFLVNFFSVTRSRSRAGETRTNLELTRTLKFLKRAKKTKKASRIKT
jgi:hypothetical protein